LKSLAFKFGSDTFITFAMPRVSYKRPVAKMNFSLLFRPSVINGPCIRTQAIGITEASFFASSAICVRFYPDMKHTMGLDGLCIYYGALCLACCAWGAFSIPDNRGKSLVKVEEMYVEESVVANAEPSICTTKF
jgi:hypothetical protein